MCLSKKPTEFESGCRRLPMFSSFIFDSMLSRVLCPVFHADIMFSFIVAILYLYFNYEGKLLNTCLNIGLQRYVPISMNNCLPSLISISPSCYVFLPPCQPARFAA